MGRRLFIYTGNHGKQGGIEDYVSLLKHVLGARGFQVETSPTLRANSLNIIIDEFTNYIENRRIAKFCRSNLNNRCVFILTEFATCRLGVESFNHFGGLLDTAIIALCNVSLRWFRQDFPAVRIRDLAVLLLCSPILAGYFLTILVQYAALRLLARDRRCPVKESLARYDRLIYSQLRLGRAYGCPLLQMLKGNRRSPVGEFLFRHHRLIYFHMRYLGLKAHLECADAVISSHELIMHGFGEDRGIDGQKLKHLGAIYPQFDEEFVLERLMVGKKLHVEITGSLSKFRRKWMTRINRYIQVLGLNHVIGKCRALQFSLLESSRLHERAAYSLHPPQSRSWPYCSPTRIYRALVVDRNVPVLTRHFAQHPIEDVCLLLKDASTFVAMIEMFSNKEALRDFVGPKIKTYNAVVGPRNDALSKLLETVGSNGC